LNVIAIFVNVKTKEHNINKPPNNKADNIDYKHRIEYLLNEACFLIIILDINAKCNNVAIATKEQIAAKFGNGHLILVDVKMTYSKSNKELKQKSIKLILLLIAALNYVIV
jgi:hypothetical protein